MGKAARPGRGGMQSAVEALWQIAGEAGTDEERFEAMRVLSDAYRDAGDEARADACAWAVRAGRTPYYSRVVRCYTWWDTSKCPGANPFENHLAGPLFAALSTKRRTDVKGMGRADYATALEAYRDLIDAFAAATAAGWRADGSGSSDPSGGGR